MWWDKYMYVPFEQKGRGMDGADCWGLAYLVYQNEQNILLPDYTDLYESTIDKDAISALIEAKSDWVEIERPQPFDLIALFMRGRPMHIGVVTEPGYMLHCSEDINTTHEKYTSIRWRSKILGFGRHKSMC